MIMRQAVRNAWPAVLSGLLVSAAFPPLSLMLVVFAALVPWFLHLRTLSGPQAFRSGLLFGFVFALYQMNFLVPFVARWTGSFGLAVVPWLLASLIMMNYFGLLGWLIQRCYRSRCLWLIPLIWALVEIIRAYFPSLAFPWGLLATPLATQPMLIQHAAIGNIYFVSAWIVLANVALAEMLRPKDEFSANTPRLVLRMGLVFLAGLMISIARYGSPPDTRREVITVGQPGVDMAFTKPEEEARLLRAACSELMAGAVLQGSRLLVLPEGLVSGGSCLPPRTPFGMTPPIPTLFGGQRRDGEKIYQSAYAYDGQWQVADKTRLVIFGEYVPFRRQFPQIQKLFGLPDGDIVPADTITTMTVAGLRMGPLICFEGIFADVAEGHSSQGAQILAVMAIDDWYLGTTAQEQLFAGSIFRAVETGLPVVRSAASGPSAAIDSRGNVLVRARLRETVPMRVELPTPERSDAMRNRWLFGYVCLLAGLWVVVDPWIRRRPRAEAPSSAPNQK